VSVELSTGVGSVRLPNPVMTAAGTSGHGAELGAYFDLASLGAIVVKSLSAGPWAGNPPPRVTAVRGGMLNSVGLQGPGVAAFLEEELPALAGAGARVVVSIWGRSVEEFAAAASALAGAPAAVVAVEVNVSCPNLADGHKMFAHSASATAEAVAAAGSCGLPRWAKLSPGVANLAEIAAAAVGAGAESVTLVNTLPAMAIDLESRVPALGGRGGGLSGPALHAVAVRAVYECRAALGEAGIVGVGGVSDGESAVELLLAGADAVQVGTATLADPRAPARVLAGVRRWCDRHGVASLREIVGAAHYGVVPGAPRDAVERGHDPAGPEEETST
jgi:dihydroorotate dehydrogenase (NAD+) catalytic subunit